MSASLVSPSSLNFSVPDVENAWNYNDDSNNMIGCQELGKEKRNW